MRKLCAYYFWATKVGRKNELCWKRRFCHIDCRAGCWRQNDSQSYLSPSLKASLRTFLEFHVFCFSRSFPSFYLFFSLSLLFILFSRFIVQFLYSIYVPSRSGTVRIFHAFEFSGEYLTWPTWTYNRKKWNKKEKRENSEEKGKERK